MEEELTIDELEAQIEELESQIEEEKEQLDQLTASIQENEGIASEEELAEMKQQEADLFTDIAAKQMKVVALRKKLDDMKSNEAMDAIGEEE